MCVSTLSQGYICRTPPPKSTSVVITGELMQRDIGALTDLVQREVDKLLVILFCLACSAPVSSMQRIERMLELFLSCII